MRQISNARHPSITYNRSGAADLFKEKRVKFYSVDFVSSITSRNKVQQLTTVSKT
jgi:hypothetical protein